MTHLVVFLLCLGGFASLAAATERQQEEQLGRALARPTTRILRWTGWSALFLGAIGAVATHGWSLGLVIYSGHTSLCAGMVFVSLITRKRLRHP